MISALNVAEKAAPQMERMSTLLGHAVNVLLMTPARYEHIAAYVEAILRPATQHNKLNIYFDYDGAPVGFLVAADLGQLAHERLLTTGRLNLHFTEWNEGDHCWIIDLVAPFGHAGHILRRHRKTTMAKANEIFYLRAKGNTLIAKRALLKRKTHQ